jgi:hypothetical protein
VAKPQTLENPDFAAVKAAAQELVDDAWSMDRQAARRVFEKGHHKERVFEAVMEAVFGKDFWNLYSERGDDLGV